MNNKPEGMARSLVPNKPGQLNEPIPVKPGMKSRGRPGGNHDFLHGQAAPLQDEPDLPLKHSERPIPVHDGMGHRPLVTPPQNIAGNILRDAAALGKRGD